MAGGVDDTQPRYYVVAGLQHDDAIIYRREVRSRAFGKLMKLCRQSREIVGIHPEVPFRSADKVSGVRKSEVTVLCKHPHT